MALLARRDYAREELRERLVARGVADSDAAAVLEELASEGLLDDARYAEHYASYEARRGHGPLRIGSQLRRFRIPEEVIAAALTAAADWESLALTVCRSRFGPGPAGSWAEKARRARFLQYRGFSADHIRAAVGLAPDLD